MAPPLGGSKTDATTTATVTGAAKASPACRAAVFIVAAQAGAASAGAPAGTSDVAVTVRFEGGADEDDEMVVSVVEVFTGGMSVVTVRDEVNVPR